MGHIFLSYAEEDKHLASTLATELERSGHQTWHYGRDALPGLDYLVVTRDAIESASAFVVLLSTASLKSTQVGREIVRAAEAERHIIPLLNQISFATFQKDRPGWHQALGATVAVDVPSTGIDGILKRLIDALAALGVEGKSATPRSDVERHEPKRAPDADQDASASFAPAVSEDVSAIEIASGAPDRPVLPVRFVHEHARTGFWAEVLVSDHLGDKLRVRFTHQVLGRAPLDLDIRIPPGNIDPIQYLRLSGLFTGYPTVLRVIWANRLPPNASILQSDVKERVVFSAEDVVTRCAFGIMNNDSFVELFAPRTSLPRLLRKRVLTTRNNQSIISVTPAVLRPDGQAVTHRAVRVVVPLAPAKCSYIPFEFRIDPDGRFIIVARSVVNGGRASDVLVM